MTVDQSKLAPPSATVLHSNPAYSFATSCKLNPVVCAICPLSRPSAFGAAEDFLEGEIGGGVEELHCFSGNWGQGF
jgi:hypothetical protein